MDLFSKYVEPDGVTVLVGYKKIEIWLLEADMLKDNKELILEKKNYALEICHQKNQTSNVNFMKKVAWSVEAVAWKDM